MLIEEVYLKSLGASIKILILDEFSEQTRENKAFIDVLGSNDDTAFKVYSTLLEEGKKVGTRSLVTLVNKSQYAINRSLQDLMQIGLVGSDFRRGGGPYESKLWYPDKHILGLMRLIPKEYFKKGFPTEMLKKDK